MALVVVLAVTSVLATMGSARGNDLVFCELVNGTVVVGATTDCSDATSDGPVADTNAPSRVSVTGSPESDA
ncbi:MAG: hypothetical protein AAF548_05215 [Actinomycetota bacterium]